MNPQAPISMQLVHQALLARAQGAPQAPTQQMTLPGGTTPTGGPNTPTQAPLPMPQQPVLQQNAAPPPPGSQTPQDPAQQAQQQHQKSANALMKSAVNLIGQGTDPQTSALSKALITNLLKYS